ncbi:MAG: DUF3108 domain-containing protein [Calditrichaeota bacterium]|nr:MAG: DUF3108 domain-containing protein [Calditrichota bacterium]
MLLRTKLQSFLLMLIFGIGLVPLFYFASVEIGIVHAATDSTKSVANANDDPIGRYVENIAFGVGEKLSFDINYGFINAGTATMEVNRLIEYEGRPCYQIVTLANSNSFFSSFYKVEDRAESILDAIGMFSWRFEKNLREGSYRSDRQYSFDQRNHFTVYKEDTIEVASYVQDALSILYYLRTQELKIGTSMFIDNFVDGRKFTTEVKVLKKETIEVEAGSFDCFLVEPIMQSVGVFKHEGSLKVWLTDDRLKLPVLMKSKVLVGSISAELTGYELGEIEEF